MKTSYKILIILLVLVFNIAVSYADFLPPQPGDPGAGGGSSVPLDGGILLALLAGGSLITAFVKKKKKD